MSALSHANLQLERSKAIKHEKLLYTFNGNSDGTSLGCGDIGILHNIAIHMKSLIFEDEKFDKTVNRFHVIVRTMRRSPHWDWVKPDHILTILVVMDQLHEIVDEFVASFQKGLQVMLEDMEKAVEEGEMTEGDYLDMANGLKQPHEFICAPDFKEWMKSRSEFFKALNGLPKITIFHLSQYNENDGKMIDISK